MNALSLAALIFTSSFLAGARAQADSIAGGCIQVRGGISDGGTIYQSSNAQLTGVAAQAELGWRPGSFMRLGLTALFESATLKNSSTTFGQIQLWSYGANLRLYFVPKVFVEGAAGQTEADLAVANTQFHQRAVGTFTAIGSGVEFPLGNQFALEMAVSVRNVVFPKKEYENMTSLIYTAGFDIYF